MRLMAAARQRFSRRTVRASTHPLQDSEWPATMAVRWLCSAALALAALAHIPARAEQAVTWIESYDEALAEARRTGKPIFLEFRCAP